VFLLGHSWPFLFFSVWYWYCVPFFFLVSTHFWASVWSLRECKSLDKKKAVDQTLFVLPFCIGVSLPHVAIPLAFVLWKPFFISCTSTYFFLLFSFFPFLFFSSIFLPLVYTLWNILARSFQTQFFIFLVSFLYSKFFCFIGFHNT
jgi:hypothetical protein